MWYLGWTSGISEDNSDKNNHLKSLEFNDFLNKNWAKKLATEAWKEVKKKDLRHAVYHCPKLVWIETIKI